MTGKAWELMAYFIVCVLYTAVRISLIRQQVNLDKCICVHTDKEKQTNTYAHTHAHAHIPT